MFAVSNIALSAHEHTALLPDIAEMGFAGLEVAPSRVWKDTWKGLGANEVGAYRRAVEDAGLNVVGLHSLFFDQPQLSVFAQGDALDATLDFMVHLSALCRDLGGKTLILGSPAARKRGNLSPDEAGQKMAQVFERLAPRIEGHGTVFCIEPLAEAESDFCNRLSEIADIYDNVHAMKPGFQLDARALSANGEVTPDAVGRVAGNLAHVHVNAADLGELRLDDGVEHEKLGALIKKINYDGYLSLEQRQVDDNDPVAPLRRSLKIMEQFYA